MRAKHTEGERRGLVLCHSTVKAVHTFGGRTGTLLICIIDLWERHLFMEWKSSLKVGIQLSLRLLLGAQLHTDLPSSQPAKLKSSKLMAAKHWKACGLLDFPAWSSTSSCATGFLRRYHSCASPLTPVWRVGHIYPSMAFSETASCGSHPGYLPSGLKQ